MTIGSRAARHRLELPAGLAWVRRCTAMLVAALALVATPALAVDVATYRMLHAVDTRLAAIADRLAGANATLCAAEQPDLGWQLHAIDQYPREDADALHQVFGFAAPVAVEVVVPGGLAALAGVREKDAVTAINGVPLPAPVASGDATSVTRDAVQARLAALPLTAPIRLTLLRDGATRTVTVHPHPGCRVQFEVLPGPRLFASSDGKVVQIGSRFFERFGDNAVAVAVAHELGHVVMQHRNRLEAAGVKWGLLGEFGRNARLFRQTEKEADLIGAVLLRNAGYDPQEAVRFWRDEGGSIDGGIFHSNTHDSAKDRAAAIGAYLATIPADAPTPYVPPLLSTRTVPLK